MLPVARLTGVGVVLVALPFAGACSGPTSPTMKSAPAVFVGAGDIGDCASAGPALTAALLDEIPGTVFTAGDNAYPTGTTEQYANCYHPTWGRHRGRTRPTPGNHDYMTSGALPYYTYFDELAGPSGRGYYSFHLGEWHVLSLNSNVAADAGSAQLAWLRDELAGSRAACTLAYWHHPVFSTGEHGDDPMMLEVWRTLYESGADVVVNGHDHNYERFAAQTPDGRLDPARGIREFVVGTGGHGVLRGFRTTNPNTEVRAVSVWGVLKLTLHSGTYDWEFVPAAGTTFRDAGSGTCVQ